MASFGYLTKLGQSAPHRRVEADDMSAAIAKAKADCAKEGTQYIEGTMEALVVHDSPPVQPRYLEGSDHQLECYDLSTWPRNH